MTITPAQLALRSTGLGSSDLADIVLGNGLRTWLDKTGQRVPEPRRTTLLGRLPMEWGNRLEPVILDAWEEEFHAKAIRSPDTCRNPLVPLGLAHLDGLAMVVPGIDGPVIVEAKAPGEYTQHDWDDDEVPDAYQIQAQWQMGISVIARVTHVAALLAGQTFIVRPVLFSEEDFGNLVEVGQRFWTDHVLTGKPPPVDGSEQWSAYIKHRWPKEQPGAVREPTAEEIAIVEELRGVKARAKECAESEALLKNNLAMSIGDAERLNGLCSYKLSKGSTYTVNKQPGRVLRLAKGD